MRDVLVRVVVTSLAAVFCGATGSAALTAPEVELVRPASGAALVAGTDAVVEWKASGGPLGPKIEEWEAFLSFNGGDYYAVRLTPHLDASRRSFTFRVPNVVTDTARILLRFGNEVHEVGVDVSHVFSIRAGVGSASHRALKTLSRGESARPGDPGVVSWVEGSRQGRGLASFTAIPPRCTGAAVSPGLAEAASVLPPRTESLVLMPAAQHAGARKAPPPPEASDRPRPPTPILLLACRQNE